MPVAARGKTHPRIHAAKLLVRIGRQLYRVCPMQRGSRGKSRGWCWWHELFRGSRRFESVVESRFLFGLFSFFFLPCPSFFVIAFGFFSFSFLFLSLFSFLFSFRSISIRSVRVFLFLAVSGKDRVMQRMGIVRWFEYLSLHFLFFPLLPFSFRLSIRRETCADVCDREESVVLITFWQVYPPPFLNLSFYLLLGFLSMVFSRKKISLLPSFLFFFTDINYRSLIK